MSKSKSGEGYFQRLGSFWFPNWASLYWFLLSLPALYFFQTLIHEGSHAFAALFATGDFPKLAPFPHYSEPAGFRNGVTFTSGEGFIATPQFLDLALILGFSFLFMLWPLRNRIGRFALRFWYLGVIIDLLYNTARELVGGHNEFADWSRFQDDYNVSDGTMIALTILIWFIVFMHFGWVYFANWHRQPEEEAGATFWDYRWVALILGLLSLTAVIFSAAVSDDSIDKGHVAFILPLVFQGLALIWYWVYFVLTFFRR